MGIRTHDGSLRYPDVSVTCGRDGINDDSIRVIDDPRVVIEILSPSTEALDRGVKLDEYKAVASIDTIALIDPDKERVRLLQRTGDGLDGWSDIALAGPQDLVLPGLGVTVAYPDIFARD